VNLDGTALTQLTRDSVNASPTVSPDGQTIAYVSTRNKDADIAPWRGRLESAANSRARRSSASQSPLPRRRHYWPTLVERRENNRTVEQVMRADLATGATTALTGTDLAIASFAISPAGRSARAGGQCRAAESPQSTLSRVHPAGQLSDPGAGAHHGHRSR